MSSPLSRRAVAMPSSVAVDDVVCDARSALRASSRRFGAKPGANARTRVPRGRHIPAAMRHEVAARDGHCCSFVSDDGHRCGETRGLQFDHIAPIALGGGTTTDNLRLLCSGHNRHEAAKRLGVENVAAKRELTERARATARDAKRREDVRRAERASQAASSTATDDGIATARRESGLDTIAALRSLGFTIERARLAAERTASLADGPLEERVRAALMSHGERLGTRVDFREAAQRAG